MKDLRFLGIGGACNAELGGNCAFIKDKSNLLLIDCCDGCMEKLVNRNILNKRTKNVFIVLTHTHADHIAGLGTLVWYCKLVLGIVPTILQNSKTFKDSVVALLNIWGVHDKYYTFTDSNKINFMNINIEAIPTVHAKDLECFSVMLTDNDQKVFYSGDTKDIDTIYKMADDASVDKIYCEVSTSSYPVHIYYEDLKNVNNKEKFVLMHFSTLKDYNKIKKDKLFKVAKV